MSITAEQHLREVIERLAAKRAECLSDYNRAKTRMDMLDEAMLCVEAQLDLLEQDQIKAAEVLDGPPIACS